MLKNLHIGNTLYPVLLCVLGIVTTRFDVNFDDVNLSVELFCNAFKNRRHGATRRAPLRPKIYKNNPDPLFCHNCGQRFKYVGQDQLAYKHQSNRADILRTLKLKAETQPTFDLAEINQ